MTEPPYLSEYQAGYVHRPKSHPFVEYVIGDTDVPPFNAGEYVTFEKPYSMEPTPAEQEQIVAAFRKFESGAMRDTDDSKLDFEGFLSPQVLLEFAEYMHKHRLMKDGSLRDSDNWQKGMPRDVLMKSLTRHFFDLWLMHRLGVAEITRPDGELVTLRETYGGLMFNLSALWLDSVKAEQ